MMSEETMAKSLPNLIQDMKTQLREVQCTQSMLNKETTRKIAENQAKGSSEIIQNEGGWESDHCNDQQQD